jgi:hypothetical protein
MQTQATGDLRDAFTYVHNITCCTGERDRAFQSGETELPRSVCLSPYDSLVTLMSGLRRYEIMAEASVRREEIGKNLLSWISSPRCSAALMPARTRLPSRY